VPQIETPICTRCTTTKHSVWQQKHTHGALGGPPMECGVDVLPYKTPHFHSRHRHLPTLPRIGWVGINLPPNRYWTFPLLLVQMRYGLSYDLWVSCRRTNHPPCCPPISNPSTSSWTAAPDGSGRWDNWMAVQHLLRDLVRSSSVLYIELSQQNKKLFSTGVLEGILLGDGKMCP